MASKQSQSSTKRKCLDCENLKRKIKENEHTITTRDVLIEMLQTELKKKEKMYKAAIDDHEKLRFVHCSVVQDYTTLKEIYKKVVEENKKLCDEKQLLINKLREMETSSKSSSGFTKQSREHWDKTNIKNVSDGIYSIQNIMQSQNKSLHSMLLQLLDEFKRSRSDIVPEKDDKKTDSIMRSCSSIQGLKKQVEELTSYTEKLKKENKKIKENLYEKQVSLANCLSVLENNNSDIDNLSEHIEGLCREKDQYQAEVTTLKIELTAKDSEIFKLQLENKQIEDLKSEIDNCLSENDSLKKEIENCGLQNETLKNKIDTCALENNSLKREIDNCVLENKSLKKEIDNYVSENRFLKKEMDNRASENESLKKEIDNCISVNKSLKKEIDNYIKGQSELELKSSELQQQLKEFSEAKEQALNTISVLRSQIKPIASLQDNSNQYPECFTLQNKYTQCTEPIKCSVCDKSLERPMIDLETYNKELQTLEQQYLQNNSILEFKIQTIEKLNEELKSNLSNISKEYEDKMHAIDEEYKINKRDLEMKIRELEEHNIMLKHSLVSETDSMKIQLDKVKNEHFVYVCECQTKMSELQIENKGLKDTLNNLTGESRCSLKNLEENFSVCKSALENKMQQLEDDNKHLRETLDIVCNEKSKTSLDCRYALEVRIKQLSSEINELQQTLNLVNNENQSNINRINELSAALKKAHEENELFCYPINGVDRFVQAGGIYELSVKISQTDDNHELIVKTEFAEMRKKLIVLDQNIEKAEIQINQYREENNNYIKQINSLTKENQSLAETINTLNDNLNKTLINKFNQTDSSNDLADLQEKYKKLEEKLKLTASDLENANLEITEYEEENRSYSQRLQSLLNDLTCLQEAKIRVDEEVNDYSQRLNKLQGDYNCLKENNERTIKELQNRLEDSECIISNIQNKLDKVTLYGEEKNEELKSTHIQLTHIQNQLEQNLSLCDKYVKEIQHLQSNNSLLEEKIISLESTIEERINETDCLRKEISDLEEERNINIKEIQANNQDLKNQLSSLQDQLIKKQAIIQSLEDFIDKSNIILEHCEREMKIVLQDNENLRTELELKIKGLEKYKENPSLIALHEKAHQLFKENQKLKGRLNVADQQFVNKEITKLRIEYHRLIKENQFKDDNLRNIKHRLLKLAETNKGSSEAIAQTKVNKNTVKPKINDKTKVDSTKVKASENCLTGLKNRKLSNLPTTTKTSTNTNQPKRLPSQLQSKCNQKLAKPIKSFNAPVQQSLKQTNNKPKSSSSPACQILEKYCSSEIKKNSNPKLQPRDLSVYLALNEASTSPNKTLRNNEKAGKKFLTVEINSSISASNVLNKPEENDTLEDKNKSLRSSSSPNWKCLESLECRDKIESSVMKNTEKVKETLMKMLKTTFDKQVVSKMVETRINNEPHVKNKHIELRKEKTTIDDINPNKTLKKSNSDPLKTVNIVEKKHVSPRLQTASTNRKCLKTTACDAVHSMVSQKSIQVAENKCNCMSVIMKQYQISSTKIQAPHEEDEEEETASNDVYDIDELNQTFVDNQDDSKNIQEQQQHSYSTTNYGNLSQPPLQVYNNYVEYNNRNESVMCGPDGAELSDRFDSSSSDSLQHVYTFKDSDQSVVNDESFEVCQCCSNESTSASSASTSH